MQRRVVQSCFFQCEIERTAGSLGTIHTNHHRAASLLNHRLRLRVVNGLVSRSQGVGNGLGHGLILAAGDAHHGHRHFGGLGQRSGQGPHEPAGHTAQRAAADHDLLRIMADLQQGRSTGGLHRGELQIRRIEVDACSGLVDPHTQLVGNIVADLGPGLVAVRFGPHIPGMRPAKHGVDALTG